MPLEDEFHQCAVNDDVTKFDGLLRNNEAAVTLPIVTDKLHTMALHGALKVLERALKIPTIVEIIINDPALRKILLEHAAGHNNGLAILNLLLEYPEFVGDVERNPFEILFAATSNKSFALVLQRVQAITAIADCIEASDNLLWLNAYVAECNHDAINRLLEFPDVFEYVDSVLDPKRSEGPGNLNMRFMEYYFTGLQQRIVAFGSRPRFSNTVFDVSGSEEARLGYLILRNLIRTYADREEIREGVRFIKDHEAQHHKSVTYYWAKSLHKAFATPENIHLQRIKLLLTLPSVRRRVNDNDNELLRMAIKMGKRQEIIALLSAVNTVESNTEGPSIDLKAQYRATHPRPETQRYEQKHALRPSTCYGARRFAPGF